MSNPDYVQEVLDYLDTNWDTNNFSPKPRLIDGDEMRDDSDGSRARNADPLKTNLITVNSDPTGQNEPIGTEFDYRHEFGVTVICEGYHVDGGGQVADKDEFNSLVGEARRAILTERGFPVGTDTHLTIRDENDASASQGDAHYFRYDFDTWFVGFEALP